MSDTDQNNNLPSNNIPVYGSSSNPPPPPEPVSAPPPPPPPPDKVETPVSPPPPPPIAPPPVAPPPPAPSPDVSSAAGKPKKKLPLFLFIGIGLVILVVIAFASGLLTKIMPGSKTVTLTYWGLWESEQVMRPIFDEYEASHPGVKIVYRYQSPTEYRERLQSALSQGNGPDLFRIHNTWVPMFRSELSTLPSEIMSSQEFDQTFYPVHRTDLKSGAGYLGIPLEIDGIAMFINDEIMAKTNQPVPQNWDDLRKVALGMTECEDNKCAEGNKIVVSGASLGTTQNVDHWQDVVAVLMMQNNVNLANPAAPDVKPADDVIDYYNSFSRVLRIWDSNLPSSTNSFAAGKVGIYFGPSWRVFDILAINPSLKFSVHPLPQLPVDPIRKEEPIAYASYWFEGVNRRSPNSNAAWELLKYLSTAEVMEKMANAQIQSGRVFGEPYSRMDMADKLKGVKYISAFIEQAPMMKSHFLTSYTHDGETGINTKLSTAYSQVLSRSRSTQDLSKSISSIFSEYGISTR